MIYEPMPEMKRCTQCGEWKLATRKYFKWESKVGIRQPCRSCSNKQHQRWSKINQDRIKEKRRLWWRANPEKVRESNRRYREAYPDKERERRKRWRKNNPDKQRQQSRRYRKAHLDADRNKSRRRQMLKRELPASFTAVDWQRALEYFHGVCAYCGNSPSFLDPAWVLHQEHHIPLKPNYELSEPNPGYVLTNILPACASCNFSKQNYDPRVWLVKRFGPRRAKKILARIEAYFEWVKTRK